MMAATIYWFAPDILPGEPDDLFIAIESPTRRDIILGHFDTHRAVFVNAAGSDVPEIIIRAWARVPDFPAAVMRASAPE